MNTENAIEVVDVKKVFKIYKDRSNMLRERFISMNKRNRYEYKEILKGITFAVKKGEAVALIGKNGCGKSTTLKMLTKILFPNEGTIKTNGRICSLIELGAGFHPDMTGRENIYINASIFGIKAKEVTQRIDDIIRFSELEGYIDSPVRTYSSGMYMRLAFSVAINVDADILLIDEILAVGDSSFQAKCFNKLLSLKDGGTTIVIVSHSLSQIEQICDRAIWIESGTIKKIGSARKVCKEYTEFMEKERCERIEIERLQIIKKYGEPDNSNLSSEQQDRNKSLLLNYSCINLISNCGSNARRSGNQFIRFEKVQILNEAMEDCRVFKSNDKIILQFEISSDLIDEKFDIGIGITRKDWVFIYGTLYSHHFDHLIIMTRNKIKCSLVLDNISLLPNDYMIDIFIKGKDGEYMDLIHSLIDFKVIDKSHDTGIINIQSNFSIEI